MIENEAQIFPVILSGGSGTRLWPLSRAAFPKQFLAIAGETSLFHATLERVNDESVFEKPLIVCSQKHRFLVRDILSDIDREADILMEPLGRNTAPALMAAALSVQEKDPAGLMLVMPSDHLIRNTNSFTDDVKKAAGAAQAGKIALFGIPPTHPHTGYGYIQRGEKIRSEDEIYNIECFTEKPKVEMAEKYLEQGGYDWNSGIFMMRADVIIKEIERLSPEMHKYARNAWERAREDLGDMLLDKKAFAYSPNISIDYAVIEKTDKACVVPATFDWDDLGSWDSLMDNADKDEKGTAAIGPVVHEDVDNSYLRSDGPVLCAVDVSNLIVVATKDTVAVMPRGQSSSITKIVKALKEKDIDELNENPKVLRPWGGYETVDEGDGERDQKFKVKRISVKPGATLSLQKHHHRSEHWVVVKGTARVTCGDNVFDLYENQSTYIPCEAIHRLENPGDELLEIIEVQTGDYLGEDDIIRFQDVYGRTNSEKLKKVS